MEVILLEEVKINEVKKLGILGDKVNVKTGYARNFLIPQGKAVQATKKNIENFDTLRARMEAELAKNQAKARDRVDEFEKLGNVTLEAKVGANDKLFGSIGSNDIAQAITTAGVPVSKKEVRLKDKLAIRSLGVHEIHIQVAQDVSARLTVTVVAQE
ncbi:50S ribosomal protein L9 [Candidatus Fukatsuia symbiotica]|uniref:Large ribosomal subunit protein bL9 n=1 Tax=Candidatus Fukatsuia symbiotica TaxID=1878942 RepID=A0A2U8I6E1_9GAMM|nr:50S ribosomal protein L9 [Candidatus Fukatsuia symbiotica]AWK13434.1 50S ribosomal protein L9 [Candidatus Fukatsuia symbiotica]MEA9444325.1 50S ribosomal protein L9 [Candidatus Fukatsuia symbiotica]